MKDPAAANPTAARATRLGSKTEGNIRNLLREYMIGLTDNQFPKVATHEQGATVHWPPTVAHWNK